MRLNLTVLIQSLLVFVSFQLNAQEIDLDKERNKILTEGLYLYRLEKASWHATDVLFEKDKSLMEQLNGYVSYIDNQFTKTIFWNDAHEIIFSVVFDSIATAANGTALLEKRPPSETELDLIQLRAAASQYLAKNPDRFITFYKNTQLNLIPVVRDSQRMVYILTGSTERKLLIGNDYQLFFNEKNELKDKKMIHKSLITLEMESAGKDIKQTTHSHILEPFISATDICTFMLYKDVFKVYQHLVFTEDWMSLFDCNKPGLTLMKNFYFNKKK